jgi:predicted nucleic acid-binding protein
MILVVADTGRLRYLVEIGDEPLLPLLFSRVWISGIVAAELRHERTPAVIRQWAEQPPSWIEVRQVYALPAAHELEGLDRGEWEAIELANEIHASLLLIDERAGVRFARARGFTVTGTPRANELSQDPGSLRADAGTGARIEGQDRKPAPPCEIMALCTPPVPRTSSS